MEFLICGGLAALGVAVWQTTWQVVGWSLVKRFFALFLSLYAVAKVYRIIVYPNFLSPLRHLPGPKDHNLVLGQEAKKFKAESPFSVHLQWTRKWPEAPFIRYVSFIGTDVLLVNSLAAHKAVLQTNVYDFVKPPFFAGLLTEIVGTGLLFAEGEAHKNERRLLAGPLSVPSVRKLLPVFRGKARDLSEVFEHALGNKPYAALEAMETLAKSTMETIGMTVLGIDLKTLASTHSLGFQEVWSRLIHQEPLGYLIMLVNALVPIRKLTPLKANYRFLQASADLRSMLRGIIEKRKADLADGTFKEEIGESRDLLTYMLEDAALHQKETGKDVWSVDDIIGHLLNFTSAGHESTATTLAWSLYSLSTHHAIQDRLRSEINSLLEANPEPDYDSIFGLPYLHNFVREVLRLYPSSYMSQREAVRDLVIEGVAIPKGTQIDINVPLMHQHPLVWGPDADVFDPDRWDQREGGAASPFAFEAFLQGPRICPGRNFALAEVKAVLVELLTKFRFLGIEGGDGELLTGGEECVGRGVRFANPSLTLRPAGGLRVRFERL